MMLLLAGVCKYGAVVIPLVAGKGDKRQGAAVGCKFVRTRYHKGPHAWETCLALSQHTVHAVRKHSLCTMPFSISFGCNMTSAALPGFKAVSALSCMRLWFACLY